MILFSPRRSALSASLFAVGLAAGSALLWPVTASAQMGVGMPGQSLSPTAAAKAFGGPHGSDRPKPEIQPDALPGARSSSTVVPATRPTTDLTPNAALFDAVNRGDLAAARDALNRGAELSARNILGMTPMELSVDLGRNDISFLLLSMRSEDKAPPRADPSAATAAQAVLTSKQAPAKTPATPVKAAKVVPVRQAPAPRLFANDGGMPNPAVGFLGFDPSRVAH